MKAAEPEDDNILTLDPIQVAARFLGVFVATFILMAVLAPKNGEAGPYLVGVVAMWTASLILCIVAFLYRNKRRYKQAIITEWLAPVIPLVVYLFAA